MIQMKDPSREKLTAIKGIGAARAKRLQQVLGVETITDFAVLTADEVNTAFVGKKNIGSPQDIEGWIAQARELAGAQNDEAASVAVTAVVDEKWQPFASFVVEFQERQSEGVIKQRTSVQYMEGDVTETWDGIAEQPVCQWMQEQVRDQIRTVPADDSAVDANQEPIAEPETAVVSPLDWTIEQLAIFQPPEASHPVAVGQPDMSFIGFIRSDLASLFRVVLTAADLQSTEEAIAQNYQMQLFARNLSLGVNTPLNLQLDESFSGENAAAYQVLAAEGVLQPGRYRLGVFLKDDRPGGGVNYLELPPLQIV